MPVPSRVLEPASIEEAWNVIQMATANVAKLFQEKRPMEVAEQISLCSPSLRLLARSATTSDQQRSLDEQTTRAFRAVNLIAQESMAGNQQGAEAVFEELRKTLHEMAAGFEAGVVHAEIYHCLTHPEIVSMKASGTCDTCGRKLSVRRIPYSFIYVRPDPPLLKLTAEADAPLQQGRESRVRLRLETRDGEPVPPEDLWRIHTQAVHVLVIGPGLADFQHRIPTPGDKPGDYAFTFTPALAGTYRIRAAAVPAATGLQEYPSADLPCAGNAVPTPPLTETHSCTVGDGLRFDLSFSPARATPLRAGEVRMMRIQVADAQGQPVNRLEPVLNAFAHVTAFYADNETVFQLHPVGGDILSEDLRGGPWLSFKFYPPKAGTIRFYCQVRLDGKTFMAPLVVNISE